MVLSGDRGESDIRTLIDPEDRSFRSGAIDSFVMSVKK